MSRSPFRFDCDFAAPERELGEALYADGKVDLTEDGDGGLHEAYVRHFNRRVLVSFHADATGDVSRHECDCAHFDNEGTGCEHLWALVAALADRLGTDEGDDHPAFRPRYLLQPDASIAAGAPVVALVADDGSPRALDAALWADIHDDLDVAALRALAPAADGFADKRLGGGFIRPNGPWSLPLDTAARIVRTILGTGRLHVGERLEPGSTALSTRPGAELELHLEPRRTAGGEVELRGGLRSADVTADVANVKALIPGESAWVVIGDRLHPVAHHGAHGWLRTLAKKPPLRLPESRFEAFLAEMSRTHPLPRLARADETAPLPVADGAPRGAIDLERQGRDVLARPSFLYGRAHAVLPSARGDLVLDEASRCQWKRRPAVEGRLLTQLLDLGAEADPDHAATWLIRERTPVEIASPLLAAGWSVRIDRRQLRRGTARAFEITRAGDREWFRLEGGASADGEPIPLATVLASLRAGRDLVELDDGTLMALEAEERKRLEAMVPLLDLARDHVGGLALDPAQALLAEAVVGDRLEGDPAFVALRERFGRFTAVGDVPPSARLRATLRPYQQQGLAWMSFLEEFGLGGCLADDMGLGKTIQTIAELLRRNDRGARGPHLVVVPRSLLANWRAELERFAPDLEVIEHFGPARRVGGWRAGAVVLTTYGIMRRDVGELAALHLDLLVLDEAHAIKNRSSRAATAARSLVAHGRLALTGTPVENRAEELWSLMEFLNPGLLGSATGFSQLLRTRDEAGRAALRRALRPVLLRRTKEEAAPDLPRLIEQTVLCDMGPEQRRLYRSLREAAQARLERREIEPSRPAEVLEALLRLRQVACHPALVSPDTEAGSGKVDVLLSRLREIREEGRKALVFSQFTRFLDLVRKELEGEGHEVAWLDGSTRDREAPVARFQTEESCGLFLISLRAGGTGLNLTAADTVFILDPWWNPAVEDQAIGRAHRIGQESTVFALRLVTRDTVEEKILALQGEKRELVDALVGESGGLAGITSEDLAELFG